MILLVAAAFAADPVQVRAVEHLGGSYTVVTVQLDAGDADVRLYGGRSGGLTFADATAAAAKEGRAVVALMNGGMYGHDDGPIGLFVADGEVRHPISLAEGEGNFHLMPNGVFWIDAAGAGHVDVSAAAPTDPAAVRYATQSGPMLVIDGAIHPAFQPRSANQLPRNGVGVSPDGRTVHLAISDGSVRFHDFATLFRDALGCEDALFLDGVVSNLWTTGTPQRSRYGAVIAVTRPAATP